MKLRPSPSNVSSKRQARFLATARPKQYSRSVAYRASAVSDLLDRLKAALADRYAIERGDDIETALGLVLAMPWAEGRGGEWAVRRFVGILYLGLSTGERR